MSLWLQASTHRDSEAYLSDTNGNNNVHIGVVNQPYVSNTHDESYRPQHLGYHDDYREFIPAESWNCSSARLATYSPHTHRIDDVHAYDPYDSDQGLVFGGGRPEHHGWINQQTHRPNTTIFDLAKTQMSGATKGPGFHNLTKSTSKSRLSSRKSPMAVGAVASRIRMSSRRGSGTARYTSSQGLGYHLRNLSQQTLYLTDSSTRNLGQNNLAVADLNQDATTSPMLGLSSRLHTADYTNAYAIATSQLRDEELNLYVSDYASASYGSVFSQIREVNREARGEIEFLSKACRILRSTALMTIFLMLVLIIPFAMVVLGVKYLHSCPSEPNLPIYLLVGGCFWMLKMFTMLWRQMRERKSAESVESLDDENRGDFIANKSTHFTDFVLSSFLLIWFGFGNYWTWRIYQPPFSMLLHEPSNWCDRTLYVFTMGQIFICYGCFGLFMCSIGCLCCARHVCCFTDKRPSR